SLSQFYFLPILRINPKSSVFSLNFFSLKLLSAICYLLSAICYLLSAICYLLSAICYLLSAYDYGAAGAQSLPRWAFWYVDGINLA
ncbi:MAG: hypothetical protein ACRDA1_09035, partial [Plesiomonas shigelloides]